MDIESQQKRQQKMSQDDQKAAKSCHKIFKKRMQKLNCVLVTVCNFYYHKLSNFNKLLHTFSAYGTFSLLIINIYIDKKILFHIYRTHISAVLSGHAAVKKPF